MNSKGLKILIDGKRIKTLEEASSILGITLEHLYRKLIICKSNFYTGAVNNYTLQVWTKYRTFTDMEEEEDVNYTMFMDKIYEEFLEYQKNKELLDSQK